MPIPRGFTSKGAFETAQCKNTEDNCKNRCFDVIRLAHSGTAKSVEHSKSCYLSYTDKSDDSDSGKCCNNFCKEFVTNKVSDDWQCKLWLDNLSVCCNESSKERAETDHDKPVCNSRACELKHLGMAKYFCKHILQTCRLIVGTRWIWLLLLIERNQSANTNS